jgi:stress response protein YsnF
MLAVLPWAIKQCAPAPPELTPSIGLFVKQWEVAVATALSGPFDQAERPMDLQRDDIARSLTNGQSQTLSVIEERMSVQVTQYETGCVRVRTVARIEAHDVPVTTRAKSVMVERIRLDQPATVELPPRQEGDTLVVPIFEYVAVTEMKLFLKEEIRITTVVTEATDTHRIELQHHDVIVERRAGIDGQWVADMPPEVSRTE